MALEAAQHVEGTRNHLNDVAVAGKIAGEYALFAKPLRTSPHALPISVKRNKIPLAEQATSGNLPPQQKAGASALHDARILNATRLAAVPEIGMPEIKIVTEVAGRVCALPVEVGGSVGDGDDIAFVEAMKMEIPVASPAAGKLKSILVCLDDVVAEGQVLAIIET
jgi:biotin carboxyl carrier protein